MTIFDWENHYKNGGYSGETKYYIQSRDSIKETIMKYCDDKNTFIDIGCGDLQVLNDEPPTHYIGVDLSQSIVDRNKQNHPNLQFIASNAANKLDISADVVFCFHMLFHIMDDNEYRKTLENIKSYSKKYVFIVTWHKNIFDKGLLNNLLISAVTFKKTGELTYSVPIGDGEYQKYRDFLETALPIFTPEFELINVHTNPKWVDGYGALYVFKKK